MNEAKKLVWGKVAPEVERQLKEIAQHEDRTVSYLVRQAVEYWLRGRQITQESKQVEVTR